METISNREFGGERPLFGSHHLRLENVTFHAGESALKECSDIEAVSCRFEGRYPFWHVDGFTIRDSVFSDEARAPLWYSTGLEMSHTLIEAPKMFREMTGIDLNNVRIPNAVETFWHCRDIRLRDVEVDKADYIFLHSDNIDIDRYRQNGKYAFQYCRDIVIRNAVLHTKDAFWNSENVTICDSVIIGEYLGWHSRNLRLVNCRIGGTQPLCYADGLVLENCTFDADADLAFEYSSVEATVSGKITSVKNPRSGHISADGYGEVILDGNLNTDTPCAIETRSPATT